MPKDLKEFDRVYQSQEEITGFFDLRTPDYKGELRRSDCMDGDYTKTIFKDCLIYGGDFSSGCFNSCTFENCVFVDCAFVGVSFNGCSFKNTDFLNSQMSFSMGSREKCEVEGFGITSYEPIELALKQAKNLLGWPVE